MTGGLARHAIVPKLGVSHGGEAIARCRLKYQHTPMIACFLRIKGPRGRRVTTAQA